MKRGGNSFEALAKPKKVKDHTIKDLEMVPISFGKVELKVNQAMALYGVLNITIVQGTIQVHGHEWSKGSRKIYSPSISNAMALLAMTNAIVYIEKVDDPLVTLKDTLPNCRNMFEEERSMVNITDYLKVIPKLQDQPLVCVVGPKNSGKSTFCRFLINHYLNKHERVALLDGDIGQPETGPPGCVSLVTLTEPLLGPPFTHLMNQHSIFVGSVTPKTDPDYYINCLLELLKHYKRNFSHLPLIVNTNGWIKGMGLDILEHFCQSVKPTLMVTMGTELLQDLPCQKLELPLAIPDPRHRHSPLDHRLLTFSSYFMNSKCYRIPLCQLKIQFLIDQIPPSEALYALNSTIVALIHDPRPYSPCENQLNVIPSRIPILQPCIGYGFIQCISNETVWLKTPVEFNIIQKVNLLIRSPGLETPSIFLLNSSSDVPYCSFTSNEGAGASNLRPRMLHRKKN